MNPELLAIAGGLALLVLGGDLLVRGAVALADRLRVSPLATGLTVVAFGTSAPELVVSLGAARAGADDIALGNVLGSNIANIGLILGVGALLRPVRVHRGLVRFDAPLLVAVSAGSAAVFLGGGVGRIEGTVLLGGLVAYTAGTLIRARRTGVTPVPATARPPARLDRAVAGALLVAAGLTGLILGARFLVSGAVTVAGAMGVSEAVIGLTVVAVGTSLPEFATSVIAAVRGQGDIAVGNVVGSNLFNLLGILGTTAVAFPLSPERVGWFDVGSMIAAAAALALILLTRGGIGRLAATALLAGYAAYTLRLALA